MPEPRPRTFAHRAARDSWLRGVAVFVWILLGNALGLGKLTVDLVALGLMLLGVVLGLAALAGLRTHGVRGILGPALAGILINGLMLFIFVTNFLAARERARQGAVVDASLPRQAKLRTAGE